MVIVAANLQSGYRPGGHVTAGQLSYVTGGHGGAITHIVDRHEKRQFKRRERERNDRCKVYAPIRPECFAPLIPRYDALAKAHIAVMERYDEPGLRLICEIDVGAVNVTRKS